MRKLWVVLAMAGCLGGGGDDGFDDADPCAKWACPDPHVTSVPNEWCGGRADEGKTCYYCPPGHPREECICQSAPLGDVPETEMVCLPYD